MFLKLLQKKQELAAYAWRTRQPPHASAPAPKGFEDLSPGQFAEREADMATSSALYQKAWTAATPAALRIAASRLKRNETYDFATLKPSAYRVASLALRIVADAP